MRLLLCLVATAACSSAAAPVATPIAITPAAPGELLSPAAFASITDVKARSVAMFGELGRLLRHPRCINCHPAGDSPTQRNTIELHDPPVARGPDNRGVVGMECAGCHQAANVDGTRVPGAPGWQLAPIEMAWQGRTLSQICEQIKDPKRNDHKDLPALQTHVASDLLVGWAWEPGADREPAPGSQRAAGELMQAWIDTGAHCPSASEEQL